MKKPGKPKPKRRNRAGQKAHVQAAVPSIAASIGASGSSSGAALQSVAARGPVRSRDPMSGFEGLMRAGAPRAKTNAAGAFALRHDDRMALGLLLLPFLLVAFMLTTHSSRRADRNWNADIAVRTPVALVPPTVAMQPVSPVPPPQIASAQIMQPQITVPQVTVPHIPQPEIAIPGNVVFPPPMPAIEAQVPVPVVVAAPIAAPMVVPETSIAYPPPMPEISIAALDVRPLPTLSSPAPLPSPGISMAPAPWVPDAAPEMCAASAPQLASFASVGRLARSPRQPRLTGVDAETFGLRVAAAAVAQTRDLVIYTARYQAMAYPMGDVVSLHGACIDVIIRAYRAVGIDLQEEIQKARPSRGDPNIDHRRTENMRRFLEKNGASLPITNFPENYKPGDIVTYHRPFSRISTSHIAIVSDVLAATGRPMIVHNRGYGAQMEDALFVDRITGHYRYTGGAAQVSTPPVRTGNAGGDRVGQRTSANTSTAQSTGQTTGPRAQTSLTP